MVKNVWLKSCAQTFCLIATLSILVIMQQRFLNFASFSSDGRACDFDGAHAAISSNCVTVSHTKLGYYFIDIIAQLEDRNDPTKNTAVTMKMVGQSLRCSQPFQFSLPEQSQYKFKRLLGIVLRKDLCNPDSSPLALLSSLFDEMTGNGDYRIARNWSTGLLRTEVWEFWPDQIRRKS